MVKVGSILFILFTSIHGLIHLMGFLAYWPLAKMNELPYKTSLLNGSWEVGAGGMRVFSLLWLLAALGFLAGAALLALKMPAWAAVMLVSTLLSLGLCLLDWQAAYRGFWIDIFILVVLFFVFGLRLKPALFEAYAGQAGVVTTMAIPAGLPEPVARFYDMYHGDALPVYHSAVISGRGTLRFMGITLPARLRFTHQTGEGYRHYIETTFYGIPIMKVNERYLEGHTRLELPFGVVENDPKVDGAANQGLWGETMFYPAAFLTYPGVRWEAMDETSARLYVPFGDEEQIFTVRFDLQTGMIQRMETRRYRDEKVGEIRWWGELITEQDKDGLPLQTIFTVTWEDEGTPWLKAEIEETVFNSDVREYIRQRGP
jgi:hypothetical protein